MKVAIIGLNETRIFEFKGFNLMVAYDQGDKWFGKGNYEVEVIYEQGK